MLHFGDLGHVRSAESAGHDASLGGRLRRADRSATARCRSRRSSTPPSTTPTTASTRRRARAGRRGDFLTVARGRPAVRRGRWPGPSTAGGTSWAGPTRSSWSRPAPGRARWPAPCWPPGRRARRRCATCSSSGRPALRAAPRATGLPLGAAELRPSPRGRRRRRRRRPGRLPAGIGPLVGEPGRAARRCAFTRRRAGQRAARQPAVRPASCWDGGWREAAASALGPATATFVEAARARPAERPRSGRPAARRRPLGARVPVQLGGRGVAARRPSIALERGRVVVIDYASRPRRRWRARPWREWLRTYRGPRAGRPPAATTRARRTSPCDVALDQLARVRRARPRCGRRPQFLAAPRHRRRWSPRAGGVWAERAGVGDLAAVRARSRVREAEALTDPTGLGAFTVARVGGGLTRPRLGRPPSGRPDRLAERSDQCRTRGCTPMADDVTDGADDRRCRGDRGYVSDENRTFPPPADFKTRRAGRRHVALRRGRRRLRGLLGPPGRRAGRPGRRTGTRSASGSCPSPSGSSAASSTCRYNCLDRHVEAGRGDKVAFHWEGEPGDTRTITYAELLAEVQRFANVLKGLGVQQGRPGQHLHADDPRAAGRRAGLRPHRRRPLGRVRRLLARRARRPDQRRRGQGAHHRRRRLAARRGRRRSRPNADVARGRHADDRARRRRAAHRATTSTWSDGRDRLVPRPDGRGRRRSARPSRWTASTCSSCSTPRAPRPSPRASCTPRGGYLTQVAFTHKYVFDLHPDTDVYWCAADIGWVTGHSYIVYGPLANGATSVMYEGTPDFPGKDRWWAIIEKYGVTILYTAPTAIRTFMKWGAEEPAKHDLSSPAAARLGGRAHQPRGVDVVPASTSAAARCPVVDTWWQTETGAHHDQPAARVHHDSSRARRRSRCRASAPRSSTTTAAPVDARRRLPHAHPAVAVDAARHLRRPGALPRHLLEPVRRAATSPATAPSSTTTATSGCSAGSTTS